MADRHRRRRCKAVQDNSSGQLPQRRGTMWFGMAIYTALFRPLLFRLSPERAQALADWFLERRLLMQALSPYFNCRDSRLRVSAGGLTFPSPVGMAAGYDKDCRFLDGLLSLGFGYVVGGTVTREARPGNPRPRLMRLPDRQSLINALGFPGKGLDAAKSQLERLQARRGGRLEPVIVSVAGLTIDEFLACHAVLQPLCDAIELKHKLPKHPGHTCLPGTAELQGPAERRERPALQAFVREDTALYGRRGQGARPCPGTNCGRAGRERHHRRQHQAGGSTSSRHGAGRPQRTRLVGRHPAHSGRRPFGGGEATSPSMPVAASLTRTMPSALSKPAPTPCNY